jgi:hypothetical protein
MNCRSTNSEATRRCRGTRRDLATESQSYRGARHNEIRRGAAKRPNSQRAFSSRIKEPECLRVSVTLWLDVLRDVCDLHAGSVY